MINADKLLDIEFEKGLQNNSHISPYELSAPSIKVQEGPHHNSISLIIEADSISAQAKSMCQKVGLSCSATGIPYPNIDNVQRVLSHYQHPLRFDEFHQKIFKPDGSEWHESDTLNLTVTFQRIFGCHHMPTDKVDQGIAIWAYQNRSNEPRDYFDSLQWDGTVRIDTFFPEYAGCPVNEYTGSVSRNFWLSMVARIYRPGIKADNMVIIEGPQGIKKSTMFKVIGGKWYSAFMGNLDNKDFYLAIQGKLIIEFPELQNFDRTDIRLLKGIISNPTDRFRAPFAKRPQDYPRQTVFVGTTNEHIYLLDDTGGRRYWPIRTQVGMINIGKLKANRDQLFAEAVHIFKSDMVADDSERTISSWWKVPESAKEEQEARRQAHPWQETIEDWIENKSWVTTSEIMDKCFGIPPKERNKGHSMIIGKILTFLKWDHKQIPIEGSKKWAYVNPKKSGNKNAIPT